jgi:hypothetical protein
LNLDPFVQWPRQIQAGSHGEVVIVATMAIRRKVKQGDVVDSTKTSSSSNITEPRVPLPNPPVTYAQVTPASVDLGAKEPRQPITASTMQVTSKASSSNVAQAQVPSSILPITNSQAGPTSVDPGAKEHQQPITASALQETSKASSSNVAQAQVPSLILPVTDVQAGPAGANPEAKEPQPVTESAVQQTPALSTSQRLWNDAYDSLENDNDTAELVKAYVKTLTTVLKAEKAFDTSASGASDVSTELKDPTKRQMHMKKLVEEGQAKVSTVSKITMGVGNVAQFILSAKGMIDLAIQNIPQAALPWAGVCVGLQVSTHPSFNCLFSVSTDTHPPFNRLFSVSTDIHLDSLESCESDKIQPWGHHSCYF